MRSVNLEISCIRMGSGPALFGLARFYCIRYALFPAVMNSNEHFCETIFMLFILEIEVHKLVFFHTNQAESSTLTNQMYSYQ